MSKSKSTKDMLDEEISLALRETDFFIVSLFHDGHHERHPLKTLELARQVAVLLPKARGSKRKAIVYAVVRSNSVMIPDNFIVP